MYIIYRRLATMAAAYSVTFHCFVFNIGPMTIFVDVFFFFLNVYLSSQYWSCVQNAASTVSSRRSMRAVRATIRWCWWKKRATGGRVSAAASLTTTASSAVLRAFSTCSIAPAPADARASSTYRHCAISSIRARKTSPATWKPPTAASQVCRVRAILIRRISVYVIVSKRMHVLSDVFTAW